jgi:hypothetical protein
MVTDHIVVEYQHKGENGGIVCFSIVTEDYKRVLAVFHSGVTLFFIIFVKTSKIFIIKVLKDSMFGVYKHGSDLIEAVFSNYEYKMYYHKIL